MTPTRREFIKQFGVMLASLVAARCAPSPVPMPPGGESESPRDRLRSYWRQLDRLAQQTQEGQERGGEVREELVAAHRAALDDLVASGELDSAVAEQVQIAFSEATYHAWRSNAQMTCYKMAWSGVALMSGRGELVRQAELLAGLADSDTVDPDTLAQAQAALERDIAFLSLSDADLQILYDEFTQAAGDPYAHPALGELGLEITPEAAKAARFLVELLLEE